MIVTDQAALRLPCTPVRNVREGREIAHKIIGFCERLNKKAMNSYRKSDGKGGKPNPVLALGLAANQIGIQKQVAVVFVNNRPVVLMNPVITAHASVKIPFTEGCLSQPGVNVETYRWPWVTVDTLNAGAMHFGALELGRGPGDPLDILRSVVVQHEIAHLRGLLMEDFTAVDSQPDFA